MTATGQLQAGHDGGQFGAMVFLVRQLLARCNTVELVKVIACRPIGSPDPGDGLMSGVVDVKPMVNMIDGAGVATEHGVLFNLPYFRLQGGYMAIKLEPMAGDIGIAAFCGRDIQVAKRIKDVSNPGSSARFSMADGVYFGGFCNDMIVATHYIEFLDAAINIVSPTEINLLTPLATYNGNEIMTV
jgi:hypothetical protein